MKHPRLAVPGICILLAELVWVVFGQTLEHEFINHDDNIYVYENPVVTKGLTLRGIAWAFTYAEIGHWHPFTWFSHMLDCNLYGLQPWGHHLTNVLLHGAAAIFLFLALLRMTGVLWRSAFVAAVFAVHPLHVESVAWVAERKDVLSGVFFMLTLWTYACYAQKTISQVYSYFAALGLFAAGLMCKGMLVTLPLVLLLLDYWPLNRLKVKTPDGRPIPPAEIRGTFFGLFVEKIPFFALSILSCIMTNLSPEKVPASERLSLYSRAGNAMVSCVIYLRQMFYPAGLAIPYPFPANGWQAPEVAAALALLVAISTLAALLWKRLPAFAVGWFWYLGMLVPVSGIVQISYYAHADRYTYLPQIGLYLLLAWTVADLFPRLPAYRFVLGGLSATTIAALMLCAHIQAAYWQSNLTLWDHTLAVTADNFVAQYNLGIALAESGQLEKGISHYQKALKIKPNSAEVHYDLGVALHQMGQLDDAILHYKMALEAIPDMVDAHLYLGIAFRQKGEVNEAVNQFQKALKIKPGYAEAHYNLGLALQQSGQINEAVIQFKNAIGIEPGYAEAHYSLGYVFQQSGQLDEAIAQYQKALESAPDMLDAHLNLGIAFQQKGEGDEGLAQFQKALKIQPRSPEARNNIGFALLQRGEPGKAIAYFQEALEIKHGYAEASNNLGLALMQEGRMDEATVHFEKALEIQPSYAEAHYNLGLVYQQKGRAGEAITQYQKVLDTKPGFTGALNKLAYLLAACPQASLRNGSKAVELAVKADKAAAGGDPVVLGTLAAAYAETGRFPEAVETVQRALKLSDFQSNATLSGLLRSQLTLYQAQTPFRDYGLMKRSPDKP